MSRVTFVGHDILSGVGPGQSFGVTITSNVPVVAQEVLIDPKPGVALAHAVMGSPSLNSQFTFGEGTSESNWITFVSATNPGATAVTVTATYYFEGAFGPVTRTVSLAANSHTTLANFDVATGVAAGRRYGVKITSSAPIISQEVAIDVSRYLAYSSARLAPMGTRIGCGEIQFFELTHPETPPATSLPSPTESFTLSPPLNRTRPRATSHSRRASPMHARTKAA